MAYETVTASEARAEGRRAPPVSKRRIDDSLAVGPMPALAGLEALFLEGYSTIIDIRRDPQAHRVLAQEAEAHEARRIGFYYIRHSLNLEDATLDDLSFVIDLIRESPQPVFLACDTGEAAHLLGLMASGAFSTANEVLTRMLVMGAPSFDVDLVHAARIWFGRYGQEVRAPRSVTAYD